VSKSLASLLAVCMVCLGASTVSADVLTVSGQITQSTADGTGPAMNNPSLNNIHDLDAYTVTLAFMSSIAGPGMYDLTGSSLMFNDASAPASESSFGSIHLIVTSNGILDNISLLGCLTTGSDCSLGNQLDANFQIPATGLNSQNVAAAGLDQPHPLDLLEDDGVTDIHGTISSYSYARSSAIPEPTSLLLFTGGLAFVGLAARNYRPRRNQERNGR
jgi:PEP-CTERM motif